MNVNFDLLQRDWTALSAATLILLGLMVTGWLAFGALAIGIVLILGIALVLLILLQIRREYRLHSEQTEALFEVYFSLSEGLPPLRETGVWAASPDFLRLVYKRIRTEEPGLVVELGSGSSTIVGGHALRQNGTGHLVSLEHSKEHARESRKMVSVHSLGEYSEVLYAPLTHHTLDGETWDWYGLEDFDPEAPIDLVIVDGPPGHLQKLSRYPALPLLSNWLSDDATFIVDDGDREDEKIIVGKWTKENPSITSEYRKTQRGAYLLKHE